MTLALIGNSLLRIMIRQNLVTFPAQVQPFIKGERGEVAQQLAQLYFIRGWRLQSICRRYGFNKRSAQKLLTEWKTRAVESGYIQEIEPVAVAKFLQEAVGEDSAAEMSSPQGGPLAKAIPPMPRPAGATGSFHFPFTGEFPVSGIIPDHSRAKVLMLDRDL